MTYLWNLNAVRSNGTLKKGMTVEILKNGTSAKPSLKEIAEALSLKYNTRVSASHCGHSNFELEKH